MSTRCDLSENATMLFIVLALGAIAMFIWNNQKELCQKS